MTKAFLIAGTALLAIAGTAGAQTVNNPAATAPAADTTATDTTDTTATDTTKTTSDQSGAAKDAMTTDQTTTDQTTAAQTAPAADAPATDNAISTAQAQPGSTPAATGTTSAAVQAEWAKYDKGNKGSLTPLEFGEWVMAANGQDMTTQVASTRTSKRAGLPAVKVLNATAGAFSKADTNKDRTVSPDELTNFLNG